MEDSDRKEFADTLRASLEVTGGTLTRDAVETWWRLLRPYPIQHVRQALQDHLTESVYVPKPADVIQRIQRMDGHPGSDEAWRYALAAMDEDSTVVWTPEIAAAKTAADPIYAEGDRVGARMAFKDAYEAQIREARKAGRPARWRITPGRDPQEREAVARDALERGLIGSDYARHFISGPTELPLALSADLRAAVTDETGGNDNGENDPE